MPVARGTFTMDGNKNRVTAKAIEDAMSNAIKDCLSQGITDSDEVREAMMTARRRVLEAVSFQSRGGRVIINRNAVGTPDIVSEDAAAEAVATPRRSVWSRLKFW